MFSHNLPLSRLSPNEPVNTYDSLEEERNENNNAVLYSLILAIESIENFHIKGSISNFEYNSMTADYFGRYFQAELSAAQTMGIDKIAFRNQFFAKNFDANAVIHARTAIDKGLQHNYTQDIAELSNSLNQLSDSIYVAVPVYTFIDCYMAFKKLCTNLIANYGVNFNAPREVDNIINALKQYPSDSLIPQDQAESIFKPSLEKIKKQLQSIM
ncbi:hypothetical protein WA158_001796 [Blastocystis sp. Blastoise]